MAINPSGQVTITWNVIQAVLLAFVIGLLVGRWTAHSAQDELAQQALDMQQETLKELGGVKR